MPASGPLECPVPSLSSVDPALAFVLCLARMADSDGLITDEERVLLTRMAATLDPPWDVPKLVAFAAKTPLEELAQAIENPADRFFLAARAWAMANADGMLHEQERRLFVELTTALGLSPDDQRRARRLVAAEGELDPELEQWLRETHAGSSFAELPPVRDPFDQIPALRTRLNLAQAAIQERLLRTLREVATRLLPDASPERVSSVADILAEPRLMEVLDDLDRAAESDQRRLDLLEASDELKGHAERAEGLCARRRAARERIESLRARRAAFDRDDFRWLYERNHHADRQHDGFQQFMRVMTLAPWRERRAEEEALAALGVPDFRCAVEEYHRLERDLRHAERELERVGHAETALEELVIEREDLRERVAAEPDRRVAGMRGALVEAFTRTHLSALFGATPDQHRGQIARCCALESKLLALETLRARLAAVERDLHSARTAAAGSEDTPPDPALLTRAITRAEAVVPQLDRLREAVVAFDDYDGWRASLEEHGTDPRALFTGETAELADTVLGPPTGAIEAVPTVTG